MKANKISVIALERLTKTSQIKLMSLFGNVMNIDTDYGLFSIHKSHIPKTPFALIIEDDSIYHQVHAILTSFSNLYPIAVPDLIKNLAENAEVYTSFMTPSQDKPDASSYVDIAAEISAMLKKSADLGGLSDLSRHILITSDGVTTDFFCESSTLISFITRRLYQVPFSKLPETIVSMIGLGTGLTPSMDDFIVGLMAVLNFFDPDCTLYFHTHIKALISMSLRATNPVSSAFLECSTLQLYSEPLLNLFTVMTTGELTMVRSALEKLLKIGHTSGLDALNGILFGMNLLCSNQLHRPYDEYAQTVNSTDKK